MKYLVEHFLKALIIVISAMTWIIASAQTTVSGGYLTPVPEALKAELAPPEVDGTAWIVFDHNTGWILGSHNAKERIEPASLTKIMTAYIVINDIQQGRITLSDMVPVSEKAWRMGGSRMFIETGQSVSVEDLLKGLIIQSGNDAAVALAEYVAGSEEAFAQMMNAKAEELGMVDTHYMNSSGWPEDEHYTTAYDLALLSHAVIQQEGDFYELYSQKDFEYGGIAQNNRNSLLGKVNGVDGIKTGHTQSAGYCLVGSALRDTRRITAAVVGSSSVKGREGAVSTLLEYGFKRYENYVLTPEKKLYDMMVYGGEENLVPLSVASRTEIPVGLEKVDSVKLVPEVPDDTFAPVASGDIYGSVAVQVADNTVVSIPLKAMEDVEKGSIWTRLVDWIRYLLK